MRTRVKICGITRPEDGLMAARYGADAIGLVFYDKSPRAVDIPAAQAIVADLPGFVTVVALFVNETEEKIRNVLEHVPVDVIQFHGEESPQECASYGRRYIKSVAMRDDIDLSAVCEQYRDASGLLLDTYKIGIPGGTGETFDWSRIPAQLSRSIILAGGLAPENVAEAVRTVRPFAVDVSSGVEREKGIKDEQKIAALIRGVTSV